MPGPYLIAANKVALHPRNRPGPYYHAASGNIFVVLRDDSTRALEVHYSTDGGANWAEAHAAGHPIQSNVNDGIEGALHHGAMVRQIDADTLRIMYAPSPASVQLAFTDFDMSTPTAGWGTPVTGGPTTDFGWDFVMDGSDVRCYYNKINTGIPTPQCYEIFLRIYSGGSWGSAIQVTDATTVDEFRGQAIVGYAVTSNLLSVERAATAGKDVVFFAVNNNNMSASHAPFFRALIVDGTTVSAFTTSRPTLPSKGVDTFGYYNGAAVLVTCNGTDIVMMPMLVQNTPQRIVNYDGSDDYMDNGLATVAVLDDTPFDLRIESPNGIHLELSEIGGVWPEVPSALWDETSHTLRYFWSLCFEHSHPTRNGDCDVMVAQSKLLGWEDSAVVHATAGNLYGSPPPSQYYLNTIARKSPGFVAGGDIGFIFQAAIGGVVPVNDFEDPHYFVYTPTACALPNPCGGAAATRHRDFR